MANKLLDNTTFGRWYQISPTDVVPSVTTLIQGGSPMSPWFLEYIIKSSEGQVDKWRNSKSEALRVGTLVHKRIEDLLSGDKISITNDTEVQKAVNAFCMWFEENPLKVIALEKFLSCSDKTPAGDLITPYAGTCDLIAMLDGKRYLIDFKTSKALDVNMGVQLSAYKTLWDSMYPEQPIEKLAVLWCKKTYIGANPTSRTIKGMLKEYPYDPTSIKCASYLYALHHRDSFGNIKPKLKAKVETEFELSSVEYENVVA
tara:strand:+ start:4784 stop:5557 length:774 start_codon:yes stop_codon:yes gene_type:complete